MNDVGDLEDSEDEHIFETINHAIERSGIIADLIRSN